MAIVLELINIVIWLLQLGIYVIIAQVVLSWLVAFNVINLSNDFVRQIYVGLEKLLAPIFRPIRRFMPDLGGLDLSPMVVILLIIVVQQLLSGVARQIILGF